ncbi:HlyD family secretion protein [Pedobacter alluvionis]|uniref:HlyD family efflux transporter periplasmic adaptor subunit n=1 Tax=Pedobacter alluvionis TaxID=475253 RepID=A0A497Y5F1_9SPHI|nr:HlyD family efflux transporter periplasmic adaptor subunit [Pedobacter alluvionis]RLJ77400.1 HlyD family secretion protein [Pedobacter alluvionis]TFB33382.1 HlyD family efflux transporter periplasmic adaptor subunit [Pedobacter alluvionis]
MPQERIDLEINSEEVQEIITAVPSWILRWGITLIFIILGTIVMLSALIEYPDIVKTGLKVNSLNSPKPVLAKQNGKLTALLVKDGQMVTENQSLAYFESTANPDDIIKINRELKQLRGRVLKNELATSGLPTGFSLGELQGTYQTFYQQYLQYQSTLRNGYYLNKMAFLENDLKDINTLKTQIIEQRKVQQQEYTNQEEEYKAYQKLYKNKVISRSEFTQQENKYLAAKYPLQQTETSLLNNTSSFSAKEKELLDLKHTISEEQAKFLQALNQCINESDAWILQYILRAPVAGKLSFAGIVQQNQNIAANQEVFIVNPGNTNFFGEIQIPQYNMGKIRKGERTLVKLKSYPFEQYGMIRGRLTFISDVAYRDSVFIAKVSFEQFENKDPNRKIVLKNGMLADAEIVTEESSLLQRFFRNITKMMHSQ